MRLLWIQWRDEVITTLRNGEQLLLMLGIPVLLLVFFGSVDVLPTDGQDRVDFLVPGILALAVMSTAMVSLGIKTGFERSYLVLKRLAVTPLGRPRLIAAKTLAVVAVELVQFAVLVPIALIMGWTTTGADWVLAIVAVVLGTIAFAGLGLAIAGRLRAEVNLAAQNGLYLILLLVGGIVVPLSELPGAMADVVRFLPSTALADVLRETLAGTGVQPGLSWAVLGAWAIATPTVAAATFRWW